MFSLGSLKVNFSLPKVYGTLKKLTVEIDGQQVEVYKVTEVGQEFANLRQTYESQIKEFEVKLNESTASIKTFETENTTLKTTNSELESKFNTSAKLTKAFETFAGNIPLNVLKRIAPTLTDEDFTEVGVKKIKDEFPVSSTVPNLNPGGGNGGGNLDSNPDLDKLIQEAMQKGDVTSMIALKSQAYNLDKSKTTT